MGDWTLPPARCFLQITAQPPVRHLLQAKYFLGIYREGVSVRQPLIPPLWQRGSLVASLISGTRVGLEYPLKHS